MANYLSEKTFFSKTKRRDKPRHVLVETLPTESVATSGENQFSQSQITNWTLQIFVNRTHKVLITTKRHFRSQIAISQLFHQLALSAALFAFLLTSVARKSADTLYARRNSWTIRESRESRMIQSCESAEISVRVGSCVEWPQENHEPNQQARVAQWCEHSPPTHESRSRRHMWFEIVAGSLPCSERFFSGYLSFLLASKTNTSKFQFDLERTDTIKTSSQ